MSKKNKCNGLDCEMCGNAKCPNEEKEKIIDGIDVSECEYAADTIPVDCENNTCFCYEDENCYFKQFKRLQKENEGLKSLNDFNVQKIEVLQEENEKLKARLKTLDDEVLTIEITPDEFERYKKYKQALEIIRKEYTNSIFYQCDKTEEECPCHNCIILGQLDRVQNIVKIIDEVLK